MKFQAEGPVEAHSLTITIGLITLRFATVCCLIYYELALHLGRAWSHVWQDDHEHNWGLIDQFLNLNLPLPGAVAVAIILASFLSAIGVLLGFLCRVNVGFLILIFGFLLLSGVQTSPNFTSEAIVVYIIIFFTLLITGPGRFSMDHVLTSHRERRKA